MVKLTILAILLGRKNGRWQHRALIFRFLISWLITWLMIVRPICSRLDRIVMRLANLDEKTEGEQVYKSLA